MRRASTLTSNLCLRCRSLRPAERMQRLHALIKARWRELFWRAIRRLRHSQRLAASMPSRSVGQCDAVGLTLMTGVWHFRDENGRSGVEYPVNLSVGEDNVMMQCVSSSFLFSNQPSLLIMNIFIHNTIVETKKIHKLYIWKQWEKSKMHYNFSEGLKLHKFHRLLCGKLILNPQWSDDSAHCDKCYRSTVCPSVRLSPVTLMHLAKADGLNEMPCGKYTRAVPRNIILDRGHSRSPREGEIWGRNPQFAAMPTIAKLLWPLFSYCT